MKLETSRRAITVRFPRSLLDEAKRIKQSDESINDFVVTAVDREVRRRTGLQLYHEIVQARTEAEAKYGRQPDSTPLIRALREGEGRREG